MEQLLSILVPIHEERDNLAPLLDEIRSACLPLPRPYEVLFIDDGSRDGSAEALETLYRREPDIVRVVTLRRRSGKAAALAAGLDAARGDLIATLDGDGQDDPAEIPRLLARLEEGCDLVCGWRRARRDPFSKTFPSRIYNWTTRLISGMELHDFNCGLKLYRREVAEGVALYGGLYRYLPLLAGQQGFAVAEIPVRHRPRRSGSSKYGKARLFSGPLDLLTVLFLTRFLSRPLHLFGSLGLALAGLGLGVGAGGGAAASRPLLLLGSLLAVFGVQIVLLGLIGEMLARSLHRQEGPRSMVKRVLGGGPRRSDARRAMAGL